MYEAGEGRYEGGWVSELEVREKVLTELGRREEGGIHMRKNYCQLFHLEKIICSLKNLVELY